MRKRLIDIYPSHSKTTSFQEEQSFRVEENVSVGEKKKVPRTALFALFSVFAFAGTSLLANFFFARADIQVWPQVTRMHITEQIIAQVGYDKLNLEKKIVRARLFEEEAELTQLFNATGSKFKEEKARGVIRVYNENSTKPQALVAKTRFISEDGKIFYLETAVSVPGGKMDGRRLTPGFLDVPVTAAEPGPEYNINPSKFSLPGLVGSPAYTKIYGESLQAMTGGASRQVAQVTEEDIALAKDQLTGALRAQATNSLLAKVPPQFQILDDSFDSALVEDNSLVKPGAELSQFYWSGKIKLSAFGFHKDDANLLSRYFLSSYEGQNKVVNEGTLRVSYKGLGGDRAKGVVPIEVEVEADQYEKVDTRALVRFSEGASEAQFQQLMREYPFLAKAKFSLWPFWVSSIPKDSKRIRAEVFLEGSP